MKPRLKDFRKSEDIYQAGTQADECFLVVSGVVLLVHVAQNGKETGIGVVFPGETFGHEAANFFEAFCTKRVRSASAVAVCAGTTITTVSPNDDRLLRDYIARTEFLIEIKKRRTQKTRLAIDFVCRYCEGKNKTGTRMHNGVAALLVGVTRETISRRYPE